MTARVSCFAPEALAFLRALKRHNDRDWFKPRKEQYETLLRAPMIALIERLAADFHSFAPDLVASPKTSLYRIYRDTRFSENKAPYKTHVAATFGWAGDGGEAEGRSHTETVHASGGYFHLQPGEIYVGGGVWHPDPSWLRAFRDRIVDDYDGFRGLVERPAFRDAFGNVSDDGESLKRVPPGYPPDHPAADLLRKKNVTFGRRLSDAEAMSPDLSPTMVELMSHVVHTVPWYRDKTLVPHLAMGGKTGTAQIWDPKANHGRGAWKKTYNYSFIGYVGKDRPQLIIAVTIHEASRTPTPRSRDSAGSATTIMVEFSGTSRLPSATATTSAFIARV